jgi:hypothetical protein
MLRREAFANAKNWFNHRGWNSFPRCIIIRPNMAEFFFIIIQMVSIGRDSRAGVYNKLLRSPDSLLLTTTFFVAALPWIKTMHAVREIKTFSSFSS